MASKRKFSWVGHNIKTLFHQFSGMASESFYKCVGKQFYFFNFFH